VTAPANGQPTRRERRRVEVRDRIVETAFSLFENQGYEATTVTEIAQRADIAYGTFFNHFPTKLDLLREVTGLALGTLFEKIEHVSNGTPAFAARLVDLFETTAESAEEMGPQTRELLNAMLTLSLPETYVTDDQRIRLAFGTFLQEGLAAGAVRDDTDLDTLTDVVVGTWYSVFLSWVRIEGYPLRARASAVSRFLARTITAPQED
jgi:AcrR family transcriptional regulator